MTPADLRDWQSRLGLSNVQAAAALNDTPLRTYEDWRAGRRNPPACLALACAAVAYGLPPYR